ncbi:ubiquitin-specific protease doa4 [Irineochytrium annulatum]|nr:ubiquitin-specific protease doa4 [Irineochytrium annulatum]
MSTTAFLTNLNATANSISFAVLLIVVATGHWRVQLRLRDLVIVMLYLECLATAFAWSAEIWADYLNPCSSLSLWFLGDFFWSLKDAAKYAYMMYRALAISATDFKYSHAVTVATGVISIVLYWALMVEIYYFGDSCSGTGNAASAATVTLPLLYSYWTTVDIIVGALNISKFYQHQTEYSKVSSLGGRSTNANDLYSRLAERELVQLLVVGALMIMVTMFSIYRVTVPGKSTTITMSTYVFVMTQAILVSHAFNSERAKEAEDSTVLRKASKKGVGSERAKEQEDATLSHKGSKPPSAASGPAKKPAGITSTAAGASPQPPRTGATAGPRPRRLSQLNADAQVSMIPTLHPVKRWCLSTITLLAQGRDAYKEGKMEDAYIYLFRASRYCVYGLVILAHGVRSIIVEIVPKHPDFDSKDPLYQDTYRKVADSITTLEELKENINQTHEKWARANAKETPVAPMPDSKPRPSLQSQRPLEPKPFSANDNPFLNNKPAAVNGSGSSTPPLNSAANGSRAEIVRGMDVVLKPVPAPMTLRQAAVPTSGSTYNVEKAASASTFPVPRNSSSSSLNSAPRPTGSPPKPQQQSDASYQSQTQHQYSIPSPIHTLRNATSAVNAKSMSAAELYMGLTQLISDDVPPMSVLLLDVRPMEDYVQGHIKWKKRGTGNHHTSGLVHLEPDWIYEGVEASHLEHVLKGFSLPTDARIALFGSRADYDLVIVYDAASTSVSQSAVLSQLFLVLMERNADKALKMDPILLAGGFSGWVEFLKQNNISPKDFTEYGDGPGGEDSKPSSPAPILGRNNINNSNGSRYPSPLSASNSVNTPPLPNNNTSASFNTYPYSTDSYSTPFKLDGNAAYSNPSAINGTSIMNPYTPQPTYGAAPLQMDARTGYPTMGSSFDNPFSNFSNLSISQYSTDPTKLPPSSNSNPFVQQQSSTNIIGIPTYPLLSSSTNLSISGVYMQRSASNPGFLGSTNYPSLPIPTSTFQAPSTIATAPTVSIPSMPPKPTLPPAPPLSTVPMPQPPPLMPKPVPQPIPQQPSAPNSVETRLQMDAAKAALAIGASTFAANPAAAQRRAPPPPIPPKPRNSISGASPDSADFTSLSRSDLSVSNGLAGLRNLGNTCYMNSVLQCLSATIPFSRFFLGGGYRKHINRANRLGTKGQIAEQFALLIRTMWNGQENVINPSEFKSRIGEYSEQFRGTEQHDSQEFLAFLLDALHEDFNQSGRAVAVKAAEENYDDESIPDEIHQQRAWDAYKMQNWSIVVDLFQGQLKSRLQCMTCNKASTTYNPFMYLSLPIPKTNSNGVTNGPVYLDDCLQKFMEVEILDGDDAWFCPRCKCRRRSRKTLTLAKLPAILIIHLKRFYNQGPFRNKIETYVDFPVRGLSTATQNERKTYNLYAVSNHMGSLEGGHYTSVVHNGHKKQWFLFNDSRISSSSEESIKSEAAYMLFYVQNSAGKTLMTSHDCRYAIMSENGAVSYPKAPGLSAAYSASGRLRSPVPPAEGQPRLIGALGIFFVGAAEEAGSSAAWDLRKKGKREEEEATEEASVALLAFIVAEL